MARVTVEDCIKLIPNRFELVMMATRRAREICAGSALTLQKNNDKNPVIALREIAAQSIDLNQLHDNLLKSLSRLPFVPDDDDLVQETAQDLFISDDESTWDAQDLTEFSEEPSSHDFSSED